MQEIRKTNIIKELQNRTGLTWKECSDAVDIYFMSLRQCIDTNNGSTVVKDLGTFRKDSGRVRFKPTTKLREIVYRNNK